MAGRFAGRLAAVGAGVGAAAFALAVTFAPSAAAASAVSISGFAYAPPSLTVPAGATVTWTNQDAAPHSVTSDSGAFDSSPANCSPTAVTGCLSPSGGTFSHTFSTAGTFTYHCRVHSFMHGTIVVTAVTTTTAAPSTTVPPTTAPNSTVTTGGAAAGTPAPVSGGTVTTAPALATTGPAGLGRLGAAAGVLLLVGSGLLLGAGRRRRDA